MTHDADEYNKIDIRLEDDEGEHLKRFFEKGLNALLVDPYFLLLYVPENGGKMQIIRPVNDSYHRKRMIKRINEAKRIPSFYYALSHVWGLTEDNRYYWNDISDYVDDENGQPVEPVSMRDEKRDTLLTMLRDHPGSYWWIDVLCARTDTPLDIMGDIYACCLECIVMFDCEPSLIPEILKAKAQANAPQLLELLDTFLECGWWQRVWTWQEMTLPLGEVRFLSESDTHGLQSNTITLNELLSVCEMDSTFWEEYEQDGIYIAVFELGLYTVSDAKESNASRIHSFDPDTIERILWSLVYSLRQCYDPCDYVYGVLGILQIKIPRMEDPDEVWRHFLLGLDDLWPLDCGRWIDRENEINLRQVEGIGEVYLKLMNIYYGRCE